MNKVKEILAIMNIKTEDLIGDPTTIMYYHKSNIWSGTIKLHLENPISDANSLL